MIEEIDKMIKHIIINKNSFKYGIDEEILELLIKIRKKLRRK